MSKKPTYKELEQRVKELEREAVSGSEKIKVSGINIEWNTYQGMCAFEKLPVAMMWVDTTLAGLMSGVQAMVGTERFGLALQSEGRKSVEDDWKVISQFSEFKEGFKAIANIAAVAGWGDWKLLALDEEKNECRFRAKNSWEGLYQKSLGVCWGSGMLAGKLAGYCSKLFATNCWADQNGFIAKGDAYDHFIVRTSRRSIEKEVESLLMTDEATRADMAVALERLRQEIAERKRMEEVLREREEQLREAQDIARLGRWELDLITNRLHWSDSIFQLFEIDREKFGASYEAFLETIHPDDRDLVNSAYTESLENRTPYEIAHRLLMKDGRVKWVNEICRTDYDAQRRPVRSVGTVQDITERKQAEEALRESEEKYRTVLETSLDPIVVYDMEGKVIYFNPAFTRVFGWTLEERMGQKMDHFVPNDAWPETQKMIKKILAGESFSGFETRRYTKEGDIIHVNMSAAIYKDRNGNPIGSVINLRDITEQKRLETQLQQAQKMEAIGTLAGGIAHDFNNLLMGIQGRTSLMLHDIDSLHPHFEHLKGVENYIISATDLTKQLLGFARGGKYEVKPTDLNEFVAKSSELFGRTKKEISISRKIHEGLWTVEVDQSQIEQVLLNLYVNAWQSMPGGGELYLETENVRLDDGFVKPYELEPGKYVKIAVTDTGVGMDKVTQEKVFDPFFTTKEMGRGTGLGLASAYGIIKNHGGIINVDSVKGQGATFNIYLPASEKQVIKARELSIDIIKGTETILLVDDEEMIIDVGKELLKKIGYKVLIAKSGKAAVELYEANKDEIDMVILDMIMPDMSGGDTYDMLKAIKPDIKVLLSSGYSINGQATEIMERGCNGFIQKPFNMRELSQKVREILDRN